MTNKEKIKSLENEVEHLKKELDLQKQLIEILRIQVLAEQAKQVPYVPTIIPYNPYPTSPIVWGSTSVGGQGNGTVFVGGHTIGDTHNKTFTVN
jgi:hypothetical protein